MLCFWCAHSSVEALLLEIFSFEGRGRRRSRRRRDPRPRDPDPYPSPFCNNRPYSAWAIPEAVEFHWWDSPGGDTTPSVVTVRPLAGREPSLLPSRPVSPSCPLLLTARREFAVCPAGLSPQGTRVLEPSGALEREVERGGSEKGAGKPPPFHSGSTQELERSRCEEQQARTPHFSKHFVA